MQLLRSYFYCCLLLLLTKVCIYLPTYLPKSVFVRLPIDGMYETCIICSYVRSLCTIQSSIQTTKMYVWCMYVCMYVCMCVCSSILMFIIEKTRGGCPILSFQVPPIWSLHPFLHNYALRSVALRPLSVLESVCSRQVSVVSDRAERLKTGDKTDLPL